MEQTDRAELETTHVTDACRWWVWSTLQMLSPTTTPLGEQCRKIATAWSKGGKSIQWFAKPANMWWSPIGL